MLESKIHLSATSTSCSASAGTKRIFVMPTSSPYTKTRVTEGTATITVAYYNSALLVKSLRTRASERLQLLADGIYPESQCGFRANRSTVDMIFSLRQLQEKCRSREQRQHFNGPSVESPPTFYRFHGQPTFL